MNKLFAMTLLLCVVAGISGCASEQPAPQPNELQTPQYSVSLTPPETDFEAVAETEVHSAGSIKVIDSAPKAAATTSVGITPETVWQEDSTVTYNAFTLPEKAAFSENGSIGLLSIPELGLTVNVYEATDEMEAMELGAAHFKSTSAWDGNIGLSAHNVNFNGTDGYFKYLHKLAIGDALSYDTALGSRGYTVTKVKTITAEDWSYLSRSTENRLTLITCISGQPEKRLVVQATETP